MNQLTLAGGAEELNIEPLGSYHGTINPAFRSPAMESQLADINALLASPDAELIAGGRNRNVRVPIEHDARRLDVMVKAFGAQSVFKDRIDYLRGSKARRSWLAAAHLDSMGVGTPTPIGYFERWVGKRIEESYFVTVLEHDVECLNDALLQLFLEEPECERFMDLLQGVAELCRKMHDAGFAHRDLGNQNILMTQFGKGTWKNFKVIDLNRGLRENGSLSMRTRAQDLSRLNLPSAFIDAFNVYYWNGVPPTKFTAMNRWYRGVFQLRARSRILRHPIREARRARERRESPPPRAMPAPRDLWVWDQRTAQAFSPLGRKDRLKEYPAGRYLRMLKDVIANGARIWHEYRRVRALGFARQVEMKDRIGVAIEPDPATWERKRSLLERLPGIPLLIRFYHIDPPEKHAFLKGIVEQLVRDGHRIKIALVQSRAAVTQPESWDEFVTRVVDSIGEYVTAIEVGHAINRVKWGVWDFRELARLYEPIEPLAQRWPKIEFVGPATIDFEYPFTLSALREWPQTLPAQSLSHHLYVDRRGAPENPQSGFNSIDKFALARAISCSSGKCNGSVVISEVNWPLDGTGPFSPIAPPYLVEDQIDLTVGVDETTYAAYMMRYLLLGICSGFVDRIYWWRLVARGYGLIDDTDSESWRERVGFHAFEHLFNVLGDATFVSAQLSLQSGARHGAYQMNFEHTDGEKIAVGWAHGPEVPMPSNLSFSYAENMSGDRLEHTPETLTGEPIYLRDVKSHGHVSDPTGSARQFYNRSSGAPQRYRP